MPTCKHCGEPIYQTRGGSWVHADGRGICSWAEPEGREFAQCSTCQGGPICYCTDTGFPTTPHPGDPS